MSGSCLYGQVQASRRHRSIYRARQAVLEADGRISIIVREQAAPAR